MVLLFCFSGVYRKILRIAPNFHILAIYKMYYWASPIILTLRWIYILWLKWLGRLIRKLILIPGVFIFISAHGEQKEERNEVGNVRHQHALIILWTASGVELGGWFSISLSKCGWPRYTFPPSACKAPGS